MVPLFSICIPTYNRKEKLRRAINSALDQDYDNFEVVVSDNCSEDGTEEMIRDEFISNSKVRYFKNDQNVGMVKNWRNCIEKAKGRYYSILDDDNYFIYDNYLSDISELLSHNKNVTLVFGNFLIRFRNKDEIKSYRLDRVNNGLKVYRDYFNYKKVPQVFFTILNRELALKEGFYKDDIITHDVQSFLISMLQGEVIYLNRLIGIYDMTGDDNVVHTINKNWKDYVNYHGKVITAAKRIGIESNIINRPLFRQLKPFYRWKITQLYENDIKWMNNIIRENFGNIFFFRLRINAVLINMIKWLLRK